VENSDLVKEEKLSWKMQELYLDLESILQNSKTLKNNRQDSVSALKKELLRLMKNYLNYLGQEIIHLEEL